ncbi:MAG: sigma-70 family RNA polymerase sigma factor [Bacteroidaceae bacterium]|nr:sigma-70 family RNA polymerase sigma factor [Bacteroidaceae bacterium]
MEIARLIERCRQGDPDALGELYKAYAQRMRGVCRRYVSDEQTVEDVLHDAFVVIFTSFDRLRDVRRAEAWMMAITRNVASKCKERQRAVTMVPIEEAAMVSQHTEQADVRGVPLSEVVRMIDRLPEGYGQVFRLSVFEEMSHKEIATMLGIEPHSSSSQLARAKKMLRKMMQQYWAAVLLLLFMPVTFFLLREGDRAVSDEMPIVAEQKDMPEESPKDSPTKQPRKPVAVPMPVQRATVIVADTLQSEIAQVNIVAQEQSMTDTMSNDTAKMIRKVELPHYDVAEQLPNNPTDKAKKWSLELAYAGQFDEQNRYYQPFSYKPAPSDVLLQPSPTVPSSIDNWTDYAAYLAYNPDAVSAQTRSVVMRIALNNANRPGDDRILRTSHHQMPVTWSLALKCRLNHRFALESGLSYSRLTSDFETGADGRSATAVDTNLGKNAIREQQTIHYFGIPMKGIYNMYGGKRWDIYGSLGLTTEMPVHSTLRSDYYVNGRHEATDKTTIRAPWQFSTTFGLGLQMHLTPHIGFFAEPSLQYYIPTHSDIETYRTEHPFTFSLPLGIRFTW